MNISDFYLPHSHCVLNNPWVIVPDVIANLMTMLDYMLIPLILGTATLKLWKILKGQERGMFLLGAAFIAACGTGHFLQAWNWWHVSYMLHAWVNIAISLISTSFVVVLWRYKRQRFKADVA